MQSPAGSGEVNDGESAIAQKQHPMDRGAEGVAVPVDRTVMRPLHHRTDRPKRADADRQPDADRLRRGRDLSRESPGKRSEYREGDRDEIDVNLEDFANEERSAGH